MSKLAYARSFRDLLVYQKARELAREVFRVSATFPREEMFALTDQIRRASRSIGAQIAEAWAKRRYLGNGIFRCPAVETAPTLAKSPFGD